MLRCISRGMAPKSDSQGKCFLQMYKIANVDVTVSGVGLYDLQETTKVLAIH
jgi:hypothetical protein